MCTVVTHTWAIIFMKSYLKKKKTRLHEERSLGQARNCKVQLTLIALLTHLHWDQKHSEVGFESLHTCYFKRNYLYFHLFKD